MHDLNKEATADVLSASRVGVLCLSNDEQSYGIPLYFHYDGEAVYFHCHPGMKDEFINDREACLVVMHLESESIWESVQVFGKITKLTVSTDIEAAKSALFKVPFPPAEGNFPSGKPIRSGEGVFYARLEPDRVAGKASGFDSE